MQHNLLIKKIGNPLNPTPWVILFLMTHLLAWTLVPALVRYNLPLDAIEGTVWGHQLELGYDKNPMLNGWLTALATYGSTTGWGVYLFSQLSVVACFWVVWRLAKSMLPSVYALIAVMLLEGIQYYNFHAIDFNDNTLELGLWALTIYYFYQALRKPNHVNWLLTGLFAGLGMMAKYYTVALLAALALFLLIDKTNRQQLKSVYPYTGLGAFVLILLPHTIWLFYHDFITVTYVFERASSTPKWTNHFFFPAQFAWQQLQAFLPAIILYALLFIGKKPLAVTPQTNLSRFDKQFLFYAGPGPFLLTMLLSLVTGIKLRAGWGMPLLSLWGIILVASIQPRLSIKKITVFLTLIFTLITLLLLGYDLSLVNSPDPSTANFPGKFIAAKMTEDWHNEFNTKLEYVAGSRWVSGNIEFYSKDHPAVFIEWDKKRAPWINMDDMKKKGAVFVWNITEKESLPREIRIKFPTLKPSRIMTFDWQRNYYHLAPVKIGVAILPPCKSSL
ncbi:MAG: hypothetical protein A3F14_04450 [Gammaproteobacteria bacterium RIFCSPHIGHO2_12_FULL_43_28]|nr:MAG: hypothetical protein A3F14_04450 [Gammaproteobacteria bacterium RIFCSPHIGHO2_12_FULL_43_28]